MVDLKKAADELTTKAAFAAAKQSAERALENALSTDEERAERKAEEDALARRKRKKLVALGVVGLLLVLGVIGMVISYWHWFLLAGLVGLAALYGRHRWRRHRAAKKEDVVEAQPAARQAPVSERPAMKAPARQRLPEAPARLGSPGKKAAPEADDGIEDELAALKARLDK